MSHLRKIRAADLAEIVRWDLSSTDLRYWAGISNKAENLKLKFSGWHQETGVLAFAFETKGFLVGYGELWKDDQEIEIARLLINPRFRRQGLGRNVTKALLDEAKQINPNVWVRVHPENKAAISLYSTSGFKFGNEAQQNEFNANQPVQYEWLRAD